MRDLLCNAPERQAALRICSTGLRGFGKQSKRIDIREGNEGNYRRARRVCI